MYHVSVSLVREMSFLTKNAYKSIHDFLILFVRRHLGITLVGDGGGGGQIFYAVSGDTSERSPTFSVKL